MSILTLIVEGADLKKSNEKKDKTPNNYDAKKADKDLRVCPTCKVVWEIMVFNQTEDYKYYYNFPRYGKKKGICPSCSIRIKNKYYYNAEVLDPI